MRRGEVQVDSMNYWECPGLMKTCKCLAGKPTSAWWETALGNKHSAEGLRYNSVEDALVCRMGGLRCLNSRVLVYVACWSQSRRLRGSCALVLIAAQAHTATHAAGQHRMTYLTSSPNCQCAA